MKRDIEIIRDILLEVEAKEDGRAFVYKFGELSVEKAHQVLLLIQAGYLILEGIRTSGEMKKVHLSWEGHDYLDAVRNAGIWQETKDAMAETGGSVALDLVKSIAVAFTKKKIEQHTGLEL